MLTLFIGGNHEASNYLWELPYGGWVAKNMYYMGYAGCCRVARPVLSDNETRVLEGIRVAGWTGIYKRYDYYRGRFERVPFSEDDQRSVYHVRAFEHFQLGLVIFSFLFSK